jgi:hypothetical protein
MLIEKCKFKFAVQHRRGVSKEEIIQNGKNWMKKGVMLAFDEYKERSSNLKVCVPRALNILIVTNLQESDQRFCTNKDVFISF